MQAVVVAAGLGSRLYPFSDIIPKLMFPVGKRQLLVGEHIINHCIENDIYEFVFCINKEKSPQIINFFSDGGRFGVDIEYSISERPLGTAGEISLAWSSGLINENSSVIYYGDILCNTDIIDMVKKHRMLGGDVSMVINENIRIPVGYTEAANNVIYTVLEKPKISEIGANKSSGIRVGGILPIFYVSNRDFFRRFCKTNWDIVNDVLAEMLQRGYKLLSYYDTLQFVDMGSYKNLEQANKEWE